MISNIKILLLVGLVLSSSAWELQKGIPYIPEEDGPRDNIVISRLNGTIYSDSFLDLDDFPVLAIMNSYVDQIENGALCTSDFESIRLSDNTALPTLTKEMFGDCPSLKSLNIGHNSEEWYFESDAFSKLKSLKYLHLWSQPKITQIARENVQNLASLMTYSLKNAFVPKVDFSVFDGLDNLSRLVLVNNGIGKIEGGLKASRNFYSLDLSKNPIEEMPWDALHNLARLRFLKLGKTNVTNYDVDKIVQYFPKLTTLELGYFPEECAERKKLALELEERSVKGRLRVEYNVAGCKSNV